MNLQPNYVNDQPGKITTLVTVWISSGLFMLVSCTQMPDKEKSAREDTPEVTQTAPRDDNVSEHKPAHFVALIKARDCNFSTIQSAVDSARPGATILVPAGDCDWGTNQLNIPAGIYLKGSNQDTTIIRRNGPVSNAQYLIAYDCSNGRRAVFSGITLVGNGDGAIQDKGLGLLNGCVDFKVSHSTFMNFVFSAVYVGDTQNQRGVIYKNNFVDNYSSSLKNLGYGVVVYGDGSWPELTLGTKNAVFVEDNYFSGNRHNIASNNGSAYVFRYNMVIGQDPAKDFAMTDAHGLSSSPRGSRSFEIYNNKYLTNIRSGMQRTAIGIRGGDGVIFNNIVTPAVARPIELMTEGFKCGTYPGPDQIRSLYIWQNQTHDKPGFSKKGIANECPSSIKLNRDYFMAPRPGYVPYTYPHPLREKSPG
jgi:hypothetical protein